MTSPSNGVIPMDVSVDLPCRTAVIEHPLPKCTVMQLVASGDWPRSLSGPGGDVTVRGAVEPVASHTILLVHRVGQCIQIRHAGNRGVKGRVETGHVRDVGQRVHGRANPRQVGRIVQRSQVGEPFDGPQHGIVDQHRSGEFLPAMDDTMADGGDFVGVVQRMVFAPHEALQDQPHALLVIGNGLLQAMLRAPSDSNVTEDPSFADPLGLAFGQHVAIGHAVQLVLDGRAAAVDDEYLHASGLFLWLSDLLALRPWPARRPSWPRYRWRWLRATDR